MINLNCMPLRWLCDKADSYDSVGYQDLCEDESLTPDQFKAELIKIIQGVDNETASE